VKEKPVIQAGSILVAQPFWNEECYKRSVIILLEHDFEGSTGIILNKASNLEVRDALPELNLRTTLYYGGPSSIKTIAYIHQDASIPDAVYVGNDLFWGGDYEFLQKKIIGGKVSKDSIFFSAGFVRWTAGELNSEIDGDKWWVNEITSSDLFTTPKERLWANKLIEDGHMYGLLDEIPDPAFN